MKQLVIITVLFLAVGCKKTPLNSVSKSFWGQWRHWKSKSEAHTLVIKEDGTGYMTWTSNNKESEPTKTRDWYLDDDELSFGKVAFNGQSYSVDKYPTYTAVKFINLNDTIKAGKHYMILDGNYYVAQ